MNLQIRGPDPEYVLLRIPDHLGQLHNLQGAKEDSEASFRRPTAWVIDSSAERLLATAHRCSSWIDGLIWFGFRGDEMRQRFLRLNFLSCQLATE